jgi:hypothetical protein
LRQKDHKFEATLGFIEGPYPEKNNKKEGNKLMDKMK